MTVDRESSTAALLPDYHFIAAAQHRSSGHSGRGARALPQEPGDYASCLFWLDAPPKFIELARVEESDRLSYLPIPHKEIPSVGISIWHTICGRGRCVEERNDHVAIRINSPDGRNQRRTHPSVERMDDFIQERLLPVIRFESGEEPTIVQSASGKSSSKGLRVPCAHRSKLAATRALLVSCTDAACDMVTTPIIKAKTSAI